MIAPDKMFAGSMPEIYDRYLVPLIFEMYALDLARQVVSGAPRNVLETAAGTGVLSRAIASMLPADARLVATDLNQPMLDRARARQSQDQRVEWKEADALALPFSDQSFDLLTCQFGVMFFPDKLQGYTEARRVLKPGGQFIFNVWDRISENEFADAVTDGLAAFFPQDPPRFMARIPHGYHDTECIRADLSAAGFEGISIEVLDGRSKATSPVDVAMAFCQGTPLRSEIEMRGASRLEEATAAAALALEQRFGSGTFEGRMRAFVVTAGRKT
jgi:SAM-dependent methyltransferase